MVNRQTIRRKILHLVLSGVLLFSLGAVALLPQPVIAAPIETALSFDGIDNYVDCGNPVTLGETTFEWWMKTPHDWTAFKGIFDLSSGTLYTGLTMMPSEGRFYLRLNSGNRREFYNAPADLSGWHYYVLYIAGSGINDIDNTTLAIDGATLLATSAVKTGAPLAWDKFIIGRSDYGALECTIDEVRIYNRALTATETSYNYNSGQGRAIPYSAEGLVGWWHMNEGSGEVNLRVEDLIPPVVTNLNPALETTVGVATSTISADYSDDLSGIDIATAQIEVNNLDVTESASVTGEGVSYTPPAALANGTYDVRVTVADNLGNSTSQEWSFTVSVVVSGGGFAVAPPPTGEEVITNLFGTEASSSISSSGEILETIEATSEDGTLTLTIAEGTIALDKDDNPLSSLEAEIDTSPPLPPEDTSIIGLAYDFGPDEATFDPPITLTRSYDLNDIPDGVAEEDLVLAWYDEASDRWIELDCTVDTENNTITASIEHFTTFAIIGAIAPIEPALAPAPAAFTPSSLRLSPVEVNIGDEVTISLFVVNTGGKSGSYEITLKIDGVAEATKEVTVSAGFSKEVTFTISKDIAGTYSVDVNGLTDSFTVREEEAAVIPTPPTLPPAEETSSPPPAEETSPPPPTKKINWPVLWGVIGGVVVVGLLIFFLVRREAY